MDILLEISSQMFVDFAFTICPTFSLRIRAKKLDDMAKQRKLHMRKRPLVALDFEKGQLMNWTLDVDLHGKMG